MRGYILVILLLLIIYLNNTTSTENYDINDEIIIPSNVLDGELNVNINIPVITKMNKMRLYINDQKNDIPDIYKKLPESYKNRQTYIQILYETYVDDFLDVYIVNRFNIHKFLNITYKYPSYIDFDDKYPSDKVKKNNDKLYNELLNPSIEFLYDDITNIKKKYFDYTLTNISDDDIRLLKKKLDNIDPNNFNTLYISDFKSYMIKILNQVNLIHQTDCNKNNENPFIFTIKELNEDNSVEIFELINDIIDNEIRIMKN
jgi:hypothetical protein